jgi:hypothetical protein
MTSSEFRWARLVLVACFLEGDGVFCCLGAFQECAERDGADKGRLCWAPREMSGRGQTLDRLDLACPLTSDGVTQTV